MNRLPLFVLLSGLPLFAASPVIFYTDLDSGPARGGENDLGVFVTVVGKRFGNTQGSSTITVGGGAVTIKSWSDSKIVFQPGPGAATGTISVTVSGTPSACVESGNCDFTVRPGNIYCISNRGLNSNDGTFGGTGCWKTLDYSIKRLYPGDTLYFGANATDTFQSEPDDLVCGAMSRGEIWIAPGYGCGRSGTAGNPIAIVGYPGNSATIGGTDGAHYAFEAINTADTVNYWTFANLTCIGSNIAVNNQTVLEIMGKGHRGVNLDVQAPLINGLGGLLNPTMTKVTGDNGVVNRWYGLYLHNANASGTPGDGGESSKHTYMIYQGADGNEQEFAWNIIDGTPTGGRGGINRCFHNHSSPGTGLGNPMWGVHVHDNIMRGCPGNTIDLTVNPGKGSGVEFYNNIIYHTGSCQNWVGDSSYSPFLISLAIGDYNWVPTSGVVKVYNNTIYDVNSGSTPGACPHTPAMTSGLFNGPLANEWRGYSTGYSQPPPGYTVCASGCTATHYSGALPTPTAWVGKPHNYIPLGVAFQTDYGSTNGPATQNIVDDGNGNLTQEGQVVGTINYDTGAYDFSFLRTPTSGSTIKFFSINPFRIQMKNNIIYLKSGEKVFWDYSGGLQSFEMDHNLFYNEAGTDVGKQPTWPIKVTNPVGSNSDPKFASAASGDFHLQAGSPAIGSGVATGIAWDFDGNPRRQYDLGAFAASSASGSLCDLTGDGKVDQYDVTAAVNQTIGIAVCGNLSIVGSGKCNIAAIQRVEEAYRTGICRVQ